MLSSSRHPRNVVIVALTIICAAAAISPALAQWAQLSPAQHPRPTVDSQGVFDSSRGVLVMFGGMHDLATLEHNNETWEFDGVNWRRVVTVHSPSPRRAFAMAYDSHRQRVVLFGGYRNGPGRLQETWEYDGSDWTQVITPTSPPANWQMAMAYDPIRRVMVMFGGSLSYSTTADTWEYDGTDWRKVSLAQAPTPRKGHAMEWCPERSTVLLYGGATSVSIHGDLADTWEYDGIVWRRVYPTHDPGARGGHEIVSRSGQGDIFLFGGRTGTGGPYLADTWLFRQGDWVLATASPSPTARDLFVFGYDDERGVVVLHSGRSTSGLLSDTWEYRSSECGNSVMEYGEECDDGNRNNGDGCQADCTLCAPIPESCNGLDDDCDLQVPVEESDADGDGFLACAECEDTSAAVFPGAAEICDGRSNDCLAPGWPSPPASEIDADGDSVSPCAGDCDDADRSSYPGAPEVRDGRDNDCDGDVDEELELRWSRVEAVTSPSPRIAAATAYDSENRVVVLFGGMLDLIRRRDGDPIVEPASTSWRLVERPGVQSDETWEYSFAARSWTRVDGAIHPSARRSAAMTWEEDEARAVLFGGWSRASAGPVGDTWVYSRSRWVRLAPVQSPPPLSGASLAYYPEIGASILFGGLGDAGLSDATWLFNGTDWRRLEVGGGPDARQAAALSYDPARRRLVLQGGYLSADFAVAASDTWEFDGNAWIESPSEPGERAGHTAVPYPTTSELLIFGGATSGNPPSSLLSDLWSRVDGQWTRVEVPESPAARAFFALATDSTRGVVVLFGGLGENDIYSDTWELRTPHCGDGYLDGSEECDDGNPESGDGCSLGCRREVTEVRRWRQLHPTQQPPARVSADAVYDSRRNRIVMFGGFDEVYHMSDTWEFDGVDWMQVHPATVPPPRRSHAMAYDSNRGVVVMFGGYGTATGQLSDTWEYDGIDWTRRFPAHSPPATWQHEMTFDSGRGVTVMFGASDPFRNTTWEYDGVDWRQISTPSAPGPRCQVSLSYDPHSRRTHLFGGYNGNNFDDTWEYDGVTWTQIFPDTIPISRRAHEAVFVAPWRTHFMFGGSNRDNLPTAYYNDTWNFKDGNWEEQETVLAPAPRHHFTMVFDAQESRVVLFAGRNPTLLNDTWVYEAASSSPFLGNGRLDAGEQCDDGNTRNGDGCQADGTTCIPTIERQNGRDDDCDGAYDEGLSPEDVDGDGETNSADFDDGLVMFTSFSHPQISWQSDPSFESYNLYRGSLEVLRREGIYTQAEGSNPYAGRFAALTSLSVDDRTIPVTGDAAFWLVTGRSGSNESDLGVGTVGIRRNDYPCP